MRPTTDITAREARAFEERHGQRGSPARPVLRFFGQEGVEVDNFEFLPLDDAGPRLARSWHRKLLRHGHDCSGFPSLDAFPIEFETRLDREPARSRTEATEAFVFRMPPVAARAEEDFPDPDPLTTRQHRPAGLGHVGGEGVVAQTTGASALQDTGSHQARELVLDEIQGRGQIQREFLA